MTRVVDCSQRLKNLSIERRILSGSYEAEKFRKMRLNVLEKVLSNLIRLSSDIRSRNTKRPAWWPDDITFLANVESLRKEAQGVPTKSWRTMVHDTLISCNEFFRKTPFKLVDSTKGWIGEREVMRKRRSSMPVREEKRRRMERSPLKLLTNNTKVVLTPTKIVFKQASPQKLEQTPIKLVNPNELELATQIDLNVMTSQLPIQPPVITPELPIKKMMSQLPIQPPVPEVPITKSLNLVIKLTDVLKPKPIQKNDFMSFLKLNPKVAIYNRTKSEDIDTRKYSNNIPFSSDVGRILMRRERYTLSKELYSRKAEKLEYYLKQMPVITKDREYEISYNRKHSCDHIYNFPKRQLTQSDRYIQNLTDSLCKPVSVTLERIDVDKCICKLKGCRDVKVVLERLNVD